MHLTLILPALNWAHDAALPELDAPYLNLLLRFGTVCRQHLAAETCYARLWRGSLRANLLRRLVLPEQTPAVLVSPLWQKMGMHSMNVLDGRAIGISPEEAQALCRDLDGFYADAGYRFYAYRPDLWLMTLPETVDWTVVPVFDIHGQVDGSVRAAGGAAGAWLALQTEMQMWLHQHDINRRRTENGQPAINGVWLWQDSIGTAGDAPLASDSVWAGEYPQVPQPLPEHLSAWLAQCAAQKVSDSVVFADDLVLCRQSADVWRYAEMVQTMDNHWFRAVWEHLQSGGLNAFTLHTDGESGGCLHIGRRAKWAFWRKAVKFCGRW